jgi:hypothetical protein
MILITTKGLVLWQPIARAKNKAQREERRINVTPKPEELTSPFSDDSNKPKKTPGLFSFLRGNKP